MYEKAEIEDVGQRVFSECQEDFISNGIVFLHSANSPEPRRNAEKHDYRHYKLNDKVQIIAYSHFQKP